MSKYPGSPTLRGTASPRAQSRQASIAEMLSSPPPLDPQDLSAGPVSESVTLTFAQAAAMGKSTNARRGSARGSGAVPLVPSSSISSFGQQSLTQASLQSQQQQQQQQQLPPQLQRQAQQLPFENIGLSRNSSVSSSILAGTSVDWQDVLLSELVEQNRLIVIGDNISVEDAFKTLVKNGLTSVPVEHYKDDPNCFTFDYADLNAYLLLVLNKVKPESLYSMDYTPKEEIPDLIRKAQRGEQVPVSFVIRISNKNPFIKLTESDTLSTVVEILGTGVHRVAITKGNRLTGVLSQRRLIKFLWDNARRFPSMEPLLTSSLQSLHIGSPNPVSIYGDQLLIEAFMKMHTLKISSLAVVDRNYRLLGNISVTDVRLVSKSSRSDLLYKSCLHFISVILNSRGLENGKDSFPIFHVTSSSSLARTIAKLVATKSHRLWIVKPDNPAPSQQAQGTAPISPAATGSSAYERQNSVSGASVAMPMHNSSSNLSSEMAAATAAAVTQEKEISNGKLVGVLSLTDILSLLAKTLGKDHVDPNIAREQRRRSSSSASSRTSGSLEQFRKSISESSTR
ncbi:DEKNAAC100338 [Brettanomyces naardenensis]|uniref:DEKNAAC100338 n=1 Tax=Brettanomyces naardenensis TaxID=13370 RepID=A0A448YFQ2_BRENA|nr:DEKNAAC100338 [Brettanomyces naardenensis]